MGRTRKLARPWEKKNSDYLCQDTTPIGWGRTRGCGLATCRDERCREHAEWLLRDDIQPYVKLASSGPSAKPKPPERTKFHRRSLPLAPETPAEREMRELMERLEAKGHFETPRRVVLLPPGGSK